MKKYIILCIALLSVCHTQAQENIYLHKKNGNIEAFALEQVDSAIFSSSKSNFAIISPKDTIRVGEEITMKATKSNDKDLSVNWYAEDPTIASSGTLSQLEGTVEGIGLGSTMIYASSNGDIANTPLHVVGKATSLGETEIYWDLLKKEVQSGNSVPFWAQYDSKDKIDHTEIWYDINEVVLRKAATSGLISSIKYEYTDTVITIRKELDQVKDFAHSEVLWDASVQANHLSGEFPLQLHDSLLSSTIYSKPRNIEDLDFYLGTEFPKAFKDNLTPRMNYNAYRQAFWGLGLFDEEYINWMTDSTFDANSARWIKDFKQYDTIWSTTNFDTLDVYIDSTMKITGRPPHRDTTWIYETIYVTKPWLEDVVYVHDQIMDRVNRVWRDSVTFLDLIIGDEGYDFTYQREYVLNTEFHVYGENDNVLKNSDSKIIVAEHDNYIINITSASNATVREVVAMNVELNKHYASQALKFECIFPEDAKDEYGAVLGTLITTDIVRDFPKSIRFWHVGSQQIKVKVYSGNELIDICNINIQVGYDREVPTLYYAEVNGTIKAYKLTKGNQPADMQIVPFDLGVRTQHAFNLLFKDESLYVLDAGKQFLYINDTYDNLGDGKISVIAKDGSKVETMISNVGGPAFQDPFYGYVDENNLYYSDRNQGIIKLPLSTRDAVYNAGEHPYYVQHNTLGYYNNGIGYGAIGGMFGKIDGVWHWTKFYNGNGIFRFLDSDILPAPISQDRELVPKAGIMLDGMSPKSFVYVPWHDKMLVHIMDAGYNGVYVATYDELESVGTSKNALRPYKLTYEGKSFESNTTGSPWTIEGTGGEAVGICQMAYDEVNDCVYFAYRNNSYSSYMCPPTGIYSYNMATGEVTCLIEGVEAYGLTVNNTPSKLF